MHMITGRAEDRLTFDLQRQVAARMNFQDRPGKSAVERFMQFYFLQAKRVGSLTGVFLAHIEDVITSYSIHYTKLYEVCGAPAITNLGMSGRWPSSSQPFQR